jgi:uncharacterized RDD family membrane protein YckC
MSTNEFTYEPAGAMVRFAAAIVDGIILSIATWILSIPLVIVVARLSADPEGGIGVGLQLLLQAINMAVSAAYVIYFLSRKGATPGKTLFKLKVLHSETGTYVSPGRALAREWLGKIICILTFNIGFLMIAFRADKRGLHDLLFKTRVVSRKG